MADVAEAIAAALGAANGPPPRSPEIKEEPPTSDAMVLDPEPPHSPLKRSRSPDDAAAACNYESRDEKRLKIEPEPETEPEPQPEPDDGMDEIARLVQQAAEASVMHEMAPESDHLDGDVPTEHVNDKQVEPTTEITLEQSISPIANSEPQSDSLWSNPRDYTRRKHIIPALGSLAIDILVALSEQSLEDTVATLGGDPDTEIFKEYAALRTAFDIQRRQLSDAHPLLDPNQLNITGQAKEVIRIANLASACASIFGTNDVSLEEINNHFLSIFVPDNQELPSDTAELYIGLKTQLFLAMLDDSQEKIRDQLLEICFDSGLEGTLQVHHPSFPLTASELEFIANLKAHKSMLLAESSNAERIHALGKQFTYEAFLDNLSTYINDHIDNIKGQGSSKLEEVKSRGESTVPNETAIHDIDDSFDLDAVIAEASKAAQSALEPAEVSQNSFDELSAFLAENITKAAEQARETTTDTELPSAIASAAESASRATMLALQSIQQNQYQPTALPQSTSQAQSSSHHNYQPQQQHNQQQSHSQQQHHYQYQQQPGQANSQSQYQAQNDHLPPNQSDSTPALYERARQAAAARSSTHARREGSHSTRRPWSPEEEKALMMGLDMVKGPHWSQILSLFGPNGSISTILADRTQVQLKDKARNLKLFFLKTNSEMPYYLQCVTGELKTRAPTQAARKEAEEKARLNSEEHQAHVNGILTLAGGLQNNAVGRPGPSGAVPRSGTPNQPLSHHGSQPGTPRIQQPMQQSYVSSPAPRPVIPAPQPVSLPNLVPAAQHHHHQPSSVNQQAAQPKEQSVQQPEEQHQPEHHPQPQHEHALAIPVAENSELDHSGLSSEDAAILGLKAALEKEAANAHLLAQQNNTTHTEPSVIKGEPSAT
ncbi:telomere repeat binding factor-domain-containing protein [Biscogniauxia mediterranea]|nr:telomere repeat binding factor-domain-containing protein [Biscogniauxia mediterranea]